MTFHRKHTFYRWTHRDKVPSCELCHEAYLAHLARCQARIEKLQNEAMLKPDTAGRRWQRWTSDELEIALCPDLTMVEKMELLERTYKAIIGQMYMNRHTRSGGPCD